MPLASHGAQGNPVLQHLQLSLVIYLNLHISTFLIVCGTSMNCFFEVF